MIREIILQALILLFSCHVIKKKLWAQPSFTFQTLGRQAPIHSTGKPMINVGKNKYIFGDGEENNRQLSVKEIASIVW